MAWAAGTVPWEEAVTCRSVVLWLDRGWWHSGAVGLWPLLCVHLPCRVPWAPEGSLLATWCPAHAAGPDLRSWHSSASRAPDRRSGMWCDPVRDRVAHRHELQHWRETSLPASLVPHPPKTPGGTRGPV